MTLSRRGFFSAASTALVGGLVAHNVPIGWLPPPVRRAGVLGYLMGLWNDFSKANGRPPDIIYISKAMFEQLEKELPALQRFNKVFPSYIRTLMFKSTEVVIAENDMTLLT